LREVSAVTFPAYAGALVGGIRSVDDEMVERAYEAMEMLRAGKALSAEHSAHLSHVLSLVAAADTAVDQAQPILAKILGVTNPDIAQDADLKDNTDGGSGIPYQSLSEEIVISTRSWDAAANERNIPADADAATLRKMYAWTPDGDDIKKSDCKFPFHDVSADGTVGAANPDAASAGIAALNGARGGASIPSGDRETVYNKLAAVIRKAGKTPPPLRSDEDITLEYRRRLDVILRRI
jgi:hypothetical protein